MDEGTGMLWCKFLKSKSENCEKAFAHIMKMKGWGVCKLYSLSVLNTIK